VVSDELDEIVLLSVWWQRARPGCVHLLVMKGLKWLYLDTDKLKHKRRWRWGERERERKRDRERERWSRGSLMNLLRAHCHVDAESLMLLPGHCLPSMNQFDICLWQPITPQEIQRNTKILHTDPWQGNSCAMWHL